MADATGKSEDMVINRDEGSMVVAVFGAHGRYRGIAWYTRQPRH